MGTIGTLLIYLALLTPAAYALLTPWRRWIRSRRNGRRIRVRVYPGSREHQAALGTVDDGSAPMFRNWQGGYGPPPRHEGRRPV